MTLTVDSTFRSGPREVGNDSFWVEDVGVRPSFNAEKCVALLEEPAIALWANEAAGEYDVPVCDALELLAYALFLDGAQ